MHGTLGSPAAVLETRLKRPNLETWHRLPEAVGDLRED